MNGVDYTVLGVLGNWKLRARYYDLTNGAFADPEEFFMPFTTAIDLKQGTLMWQIAHGETPDNVRNHPLLKGLTIPRTGRQGRIGTLVTKTLLIAGEGGFFTLPDGRRGAMLRAYNKSTGQEVGSVYMPAPQTGSPMTYSLNGQQYIVVAISGPGFPGELIAFKLPKA